MSKEQKEQIATSEAYIQKGIQDAQNIYLFGFVLLLFLGVFKLLVIRFVKNKKKVKKSKNKNSEISDSGTPLDSVCRVHASLSLAPPSRPQARSTDIL